MGQQVESPFNHCPHFPLLMTHFIDSMPISSIGGIWSADLWNPKYALHVYKVTVAVDMLGNIIWICPLAPGTSADVLIWDWYGPSCTRGDFFDFEVGGHDGAYKGQIHVIAPFIGRKNGTLIACHLTMTCTGGIGHALSSCFLGCGIGVWLGTSGVAAHLATCTSQSVFCCILRNFAFACKSVTPPYGPREHVPPHVWTDQSNSAAPQDEAEDEVCVLCWQKCSTVTVCDDCKEHYCTKCIDTHTCGSNVVC